MTAPIPLCRSSCLVGFVRILRANGAPVTAALRRAKLPDYCEDGPDAWIPYLATRAFITDMAGREGIDDLGLRAAALSRERAIDPGLLATLYSAPTLFHLLRILPRLAATQSTPFRIWVERHGDTVRVCHRSAVGSQVPGYGILDSYATLQAAEFVRHYCGKSWLPSRVFVRGEDHPRCAREDVTPFATTGVEARVHERYSGFEIPARLLWTPAQVHGRAARTAGPVAPSIPQSIADCLRASMSGYLADGLLSIEMMAEAMGLSRRTLQRALVGERTTYSRVLQRAKFEAAAAQLAQSSLSITEVAMELGYSDHSAFSRAFRNWSGTSPKCYRATIHAA